MNDNQTQALIEAINQLVEVMGMIEENTAGIDSTLREMLGLIYQALPEDRQPPYNSL